VNRLVRGSIVAIALIVGSATAVAAASPSSGHGSVVSAAAHASYGSGRALGAAVSAVAKAHGIVVSTAAKAKHDSSTTTDTTAPTTPDSSTNRPQNHGWFVSQVAKDHSVTGKAHGVAVSAVAKGDQGKPSH
jgi:hypothetical protein